MDLISKIRTNLVNNAPIEMHEAVKAGVPTELVVEKTEDGIKVIWRTTEKVAFIGGKLFRKN